LKSWYYFDPSGTRKGPLTANDIRQLVAKRVIGPDTLMEAEEEAGETRRLRARQLKALEFPQGATTPPAASARRALGAAHLLGWLIGRPASEIAECLELIRFRRAYGVARIPKASGGFREIHPPHATLKQVQRAILERLLYQVPVHLIAHGFCRNRDIITNVSAHLSARTVFNLDLKDAFPSVREHRVRVNLEGHVRRLVTSQFGRAGGDEQVQQLLELLLVLVTHDGSLPQGSPTSPAILNIVCMGIDRELFALCNEHGLTVSRYADDITISSVQDEIPGEMRQRIRSTISGAGWKINPRKVTYAQRSHGNALEITGLVVNEDQRLSIAPGRRKAYREFLVEQLKAERPSGDERAKVEGIIAFARRIYQRQLPSDLRGPIERIEQRLAALPRVAGHSPRMDRYGELP
jgi:RNA-directed DNA polymerase